MRSADGDVKQMNLLEKVSFIMLFLMVSSFAAVGYQSPSPPNGSNVIGPSATFNWSDSVLLCDHAVFVAYQGAGLFDNESKACNDTLTLNNLTAATYVWNVTEYKLAGIIDDLGANQTFFDIPSVNASIIYPPNNSVYGPSQCSLLTTVQMNISAGSGAAPSATCWLYLNNGTTWVLNQTKTLGGNGSVNFTNLVNGLYGVNCSIAQDTNSSTTPLTTFSVVGSGSCKSDLDAGVAWIWLFIIGAILLVFWSGAFDWFILTYLFVFVFLSAAGWSILSAGDLGFLSAQVVLQGYMMLAAIALVPLFFLFVGRVIQEIFAKWKQTNM